MVNSNQIWSWDATETALAIRTRRISSREAVAASLSRVESLNTDINAIVQIRPDEVLKAAEAADKAVAEGLDIGPLHGVPVTIKVNVDQTGFATTNGVEAYKANIATQDSPVVTNWKKAGAVIIGRTNTPAFSQRWFTANEAHGETLNPRDKQLTPGGSSGGAAAAVSAGMGALAHGNDYGGSIRYPAYACGVIGLRPSRGRVPAFTPSVPGERPITFQLMSVQGPLARTTRDARLGLATMAGADVRDPWWTPAPLQGPPPPRPLRVAMCIDPFGCGVHSRVSHAVKSAGLWLSNAGYEVEEVPLPRMAEAADLWMMLVMNDMRRCLLPAINQHGDEAAKIVMRDMLHHAPSANLATYLEALERRNSLLRDWLQMLERFPLVLLPTSMEPPFRQGLDLDGPEAMGSIIKAQAPLLSLAVLGLPAISVPTSVDNSPPLGVQLVASQFREDICFEAAEIIEAQCPISVAQP